MAGRNQGNPINYVRIWIDCNSRDSQQTEKDCQDYDRPNRIAEKDARMKEKPILFSAPMVRAILDGSKVQTRRVLKDVPDWCDKAGFTCFTPENHISFRGNYEDKGPSEKFIKLPIQKGTRLWVKESWSGIYYFHDTKPSERKSVAWEGVCYDREEIHYWADGEVQYGDWEKPRPSIHMPRYASRIDLLVTDVRVQRLQDISEQDAIAEGCRPFFDYDNPEQVKSPNGGTIEMAPHKGPLEAFQELWQSINGQDSWDANPWVVAYTFDRVNPAANETVNGE